MKPIEKGIR